MGKKDIVIGLECKRAAYSLTNRKC